MEVRSVSKWPPSFMDNPVLPKREDLERIMEYCCPDFFTACARLLLLPVSVS